MLWLTITKSLDQNYPLELYVPGLRNTGCVGMSSVIYEYCRIMTSVFMTTVVMANTVAPIDGSFVLVGSSHLLLWTTL